MRKQRSSWPGLPVLLLGVLTIGSVSKRAMAHGNKASFEPLRAQSVRSTEALPGHPAIALIQPAPPTMAPFDREAALGGSAKKALEEVSDPGGPALDEDTDAELQALLQADKALFPEPLEGATPGFDFSGSLQFAPGRRVTPVLRDVFPETEELALANVSLPNFPTRLDYRVVRYLEFYRDDPRGQSILQAFAKRSGRYAGYLQKQLVRAGLPTDLVWLSLIESGHNPTIKSRAGAAGLWQFMPATGQHYGLTVNKWLDERLDPEKSTKAAIQMLDELKQRFGNWELAMAAYNMGLGALGEAISKFNCNDFWELSRYEAGIPWETTLYVPKIVAMSIVMNNPEVFGVNPADADPEEAYETVRVQPGTTLAQVAFAAGVSAKSLHNLNPHYIKRRVPPKVKGGPVAYSVRVPVGTGTRVQKRLGTPREKEASIEVKLGDTLASVAESKGVSQAELRRLNGLGPAEEVHVGDVLRLPAVAQEPVVTSMPVVISPRTFTYLSRERIFYPVRGDETLSEIASAFGVSIGELVAWNSLDETAKLQPKMVLQVFVRKGVRPTRAKFLTDQQVTVLTAGSAEFYDYFEAQKGRKRAIIAANQGDTLASVAKRYGMSLGMVERVNRRSRNDGLIEGEAVVVYFDEKTTRLGHQLFAVRGVTEPSRTKPLPTMTPVAQKAPAAVRGAGLAD